MKNRVILNGQGVPVVPQSDKIAAQVAESDIKAEFRKMALESFRQGVDTVCTALEVSFTKAREAGAPGFTPDQGIELVREMKRIVNESIDKQK